MEEIHRIEGDIRTAGETFETERRELSERFEADRRAFGYQLEERNKQIIGDIKEGKAGEHGKFASQVEDFTNAMALLNDLSAKYINRERLKLALNAIRSGAYKNWSK
ncbi:MAG: hypothetical protein AB7U05_12920 [Mangrovibacterium sp.]